MNKHKSNQKHKLTPSQVEQIRKGCLSSGVLADRFGVTASTICKVRNGWTYKRLPR